VCKEGSEKLFSLTLLVEVEVDMLKYESPLYFFKSNVRRRKEARMRSLCLSRWATGTRHLR
jgi:hypothetical protein